MMINHSHVDRYFQTADREWIEKARGSYTLADLVYDAVELKYSDLECHQLIVDCMSIGYKYPELPLMNGEPILVYLMFNNMYLCVQFLIEHGCDVNRRHRGEPIIAWSRTVDMMRLMFMAGAKMTTAVAYLHLGLNMRSVEPIFQYCNFNPELLKFCAVNDADERKYCVDNAILLLMYIHL